MTTEPDLVSSNGDITAHASIGFSIPVCRSEDGGQTLMNLSARTLKARVEELGEWVLPASTSTEKLFSLNAAQMEDLDVGRVYAFLIWDDTDDNDPVRLWSGRLKLDGFR